MKKALLSVAMAAVISLSATAVSSTVVGAVSSNLATPKITKAESVDGGVKISWNKSNGAEKYRVYYKGSKGWTRMVDTTSTSYIDKDVSSGKNYTYTVRCINSSATKFTSGYDSKGKSVKYISAPAEHTHSWQKITKETQVKVVDKEAYTYEEPIYEKQKRAICNDCGADISDNLDHIFDETKNNSSAKGSYSVKTVNVQVGTKTITVPEKSHYETITEVVGRKCTVCGKVEMFSEEHTHTWQNITKETQVKVVDEKATVKQMQTVVCSEPTCQNDLSGYTSEQISEHMKQHALNGENAGWHTSTKTVEVPEKFHYETKTEVVGRKCTECGEIEYY